MRSAKLFGLVLLGVLVGWVASGSLGAEAQLVPSSRSLTAIPVGNPATPGAQGSYFLLDSKTGACWLMIRSRDDISAALAPAPRESCEKVSHAP
jgi:hypothetical protein